VIGKVDFFDQKLGWGFINAPDHDVFVRYVDIVGSSSRRKNLYSGDEVSFEEEAVMRDGKRCLQARNVTLLKPEKKRIIVRGKR